MDARTGSSAAPADGRRSLEREAGACCHTRCPEQQRRIRIDGCAATDCDASYGPIPV